MFFIRKSEEKNSNKHVPLLRIMWIFYFFSSFEKRKRIVWLLVEYGIKVLSKQKLNIYLKF